MKLFRLAPALFGLSLLAACGDQIPPNLDCPQVDVLAQARTLTLFAPGRQDAAARLTTARITGVGGECVLNKKTHLLTVSVQAGLVADDGPANHGAPVNLPWFLSVSQGDDIAAERSHTAPLSFDGNATAVGTTRQVNIELPSVPASQSIQILVGFIGTPDQLGYAAAHP